MSDEAPLKRPRGRPRKPVEADADISPARPAHRPPIAFLDDPARFPVTLAMALEAMAANADGKANLKATRAREMAAILFGEQSAVAIVPKAHWDASERAMARKLDVRDGAFLRMVMRPDLDADERMTAPDLDSAARQMRRKRDQWNSDPQARAWITSAAKGLFMLTAVNPDHRAAARSYLIGQGWPAELIDMLAEILA